MLLLLMNEGFRLAATAAGEERSLSIHTTGKTLALHAGAGKGEKLHKAMLHNAAQNMDARLIHNRRRKAGDAVKCVILKNYL